MPEEKKCATCKFYRSNGDCLLFRNLTKIDRSRYNLPPKVDPEAVCDAWGTASARLVRLARQPQPSPLEAAGAEEAIYRNTDSQSRMQFLGDSGPAGNYALDDASVRTERPTAIPENDWSFQSVRLQRGSRSPSFINRKAIPKSWRNVRVARDESSPIWLTAEEDGQRRTVYNPSLAPAFARLKYVMEAVADVPEAILLEMIRDGAVEEPITVDDLLSAFCTRAALSAPKAADESQADFVRQAAGVIAEAVGVPAADVVNRYVFPVAWVR